MEDTRGPLRSTLVVAALVALLTGCYATPKTSSEARASSEEPDYWWTFQEVPEDAKDPVKIAITEFALEFVTQKALMPGPGAAMFDVAEHTEYIGYAGLYKRKIVFDHEILTNLPGELYAVFTEHVSKRDGSTFVPPDRVRATKAYQLFKTQRFDKSSFLTTYNPVGSDTGRIRAIELSGHPELPLIVGTKGGDELGVEDVEAQIASELGVDVAMRVRLRVSLHDDLASIERDSTISVVGKELLGMIVSNRSLTSDRSVTRDMSFLPVTGATYEVDSEAYRAEIKRLLPIYLDLGRRK